MKPTRVVITGLGTINAVAANVPEFQAALRAGRCGIKELTVFDPAGQMTTTAAEITEFNPRRAIPSLISLKRTSRADQLALVAAIEALTDARLYPPPPDLASEMGVAVGGGAGGLLAAEDFYRDYLARGARRVKFSKLAPVYCASSADHLSAKFGLYGPKTTFMTACSSGATVLGWARDLIAGGLTPIVLAGGTEPLCRMTYTAFNALRAVDPEYCKPFDKNRRGLSLGEGAAFFILEALDHARRRGAKIYAEFLGYGLSADGHHMTAPDPEGCGAVQAIRAAIDDAGLTPDRIDYINAHGTGTSANDLTETKAIKEVFGQRAYQIPVSSTKSMIGHTLGAAGSIEALASVLSIVHGFIPPTIHHETPGEGCDLDYVPEGARLGDIQIVLSNSFAFGGNNTVIILGRFVEKGPTHAS